MKIAQHENVASSVYKKITDKTKHLSVSFWVLNVDFSLQDDLNNNIIF